MTDADAGRERLWRAGRADDLVWAEFGDDYVVYHRPSGKTHFFNTATATLIRVVLTEPKNATAAAEALAEHEEAAGDEAFFAAVAESLAHLEHLGLVERA
jgi:PqqD family protein of HPr-rel-A system